jgi:hypothetical protein
LQNTSWGPILALQLKKHFMKKTITLLAFVACGALTMFSCKKSDNNNNSNGSVSATINNVAFSGSKCIAVVDATDSTLSITGGSADGIGFAIPTIDLGVFNYKGIGTYAIDGVIGLASVDSTGYDTSFNTKAVYGTISITATSPHVTGTFSFTTLDSTKVNSGTFTAIPQ